MTPQPANSCWKAGQASRPRGPIRLWAGRITDSFYIDLSLLGMVNSAVRNGTALDLSGWRPENAKNSFAGTTVESIVLEVSHEHPDLRPGAHIGVWCATKLATDSGGWRQINRGGHPMMWPIFWPDDTKFTHPPTPASIPGLRCRWQVHRATHRRHRRGQRNLGRPSGYGQTVARELFPDVLPYVVGTPATYSFAARNGRTMADNAPEAMLSLVSGKAVPSGLKPSVAKNQRDDKFPYVVLA